jgi:hypothetical protein
MNHCTFESWKDQHVISCQISPFSMVTIPREDIGTCDVQPLPDTGDSHSGIINVEYLCPRQEFSYLFFNTCKVPVAVLNCIDQCPGAEGTSEDI